MTSRIYFGKMNSTLGSVVPLAMVLFSTEIWAEQLKKTPCILLNTQQARPSNLLQDYTQTNIKCFHISRCGAIFSRFVTKYLNGPYKRITTILCSPPPKIRCCQSPTIPCCPPSTILSLLQSWFVGGQQSPSSDNFWTIGGQPTLEPPDLRDYLRLFQVLAAPLLFQNIFLLFPPFIYIDKTA